MLGSPIHTAPGAAPVFYCALLYFLFCCECHSHAVAMYWRKFDPFSRLDSSLLRELCKGLQKRKGLWAYPVSGKGYATSANVFFHSCIETERRTACVSSVFGRSGSQHGPEVGLSPCMTTTTFLFRGARCQASWIQSLSASILNNIENSGL